MFNMPLPFQGPLSLTLRPKRQRENLDCIPPGPDWWNRRDETHITSLIEWWANAIQLHVSKPTARVFCRVQSIDCVIGAIRSLIPVQLQLHGHAPLAEWSDALPLNSRYLILSTKIATLRNERSLRITFYFHLDGPFSSQFCNVFLDSVS